MYNIYAIVILILFDIPRFSVNDLHQIQVAAPSPSSRKWSDLISNVLFTPYISIEILAVIFYIICQFFSKVLLDFLISVVTRLSASL